MTVEEKSLKISEWCNSRDCDSSCPIYEGSRCTCYTIRGEEDKKQVEENYRILFESASDNVNHPAHYETGEFECIDVMIETQGEDAVKEYCLCAAFKYLYRHKRKNGLEDIKKARWYLDKFIELEGEKHD